MATGDVTGESRHRSHLCRNHDGTPNQPAREATYRVSWTVYGGAIRSEWFCDECVKAYRQRRGVDIYPTEPRVEHSDR